MFKLVDIQDTIRLPPTRFGAPPRAALTTEITTRYANRVLPEVGLVLALHDITSVGDERLIPGDGGSHTTVTFRVIVYAPALGEVGMARIAGCDAKGLRLSTGFFEDIYVTAAHLQTPSRYVAGEAVTGGVGGWVWSYDGNDLYMDVGDIVYYRVVGVSFVGVHLDPAAAERARVQWPAMTITASLGTPGLGVTSWWAS